MEGASGPADIANVHRRPLAEVWHAVNGLPRARSTGNTRTSSRQTAVPPRTKQFYSATKAVRLEADSLFLKPTSTPIPQALNVSCTTLQVEFMRGFFRFDLRLVILSTSQAQFLCVRNFRNVLAHRSNVLHLQLEAIHGRKGYHTHRAEAGAFRSNTASAVSADKAEWRPSGES